MFYGIFFIVFFIVIDANTTLNGTTTTFSPSTKGNFRMSNISIVFSTTLWGTLNKDIYANHKICLK